MVAARVHGLDCVDDEKDGEQDPEEEGESNGSLDGAAVGVAPAVRRTPFSSKGNRTGKPKDGGDAFEDQRHEAVEDTGVVKGGHSDVEKHEQRPYSVEQHEALDWGSSGPRAKYTDDICHQTQLDDAEHRCRDVHEGNKSVRHFGCRRLANALLDVLETKIPL